MSLPKKELTARLQKISDLYTHTLAIQSEMDNFVPEDIYQRTIQLPPFPGAFANEKHRQMWKDKLDHTYEGAVDIAERTHREVYAPKQPEKPMQKVFTPVWDSAHEAQIKKYSYRFGMALAIGAFFLLGTFLGIDESNSDALPVIFTIIAACGLSALLFKSKEKAVKTEAEQKIAQAMQEHNAQQEAQMAEYTQKMQAYENDRAAYEQKLAKFLEDYAQWRLIYIQSVNEEAQITEKLEADRVAGVKKIYEEKMIPAQNALKVENDLVPQQYLPVIDTLTDLLISGRADDLKEAINLYEDIVYRERQLALEREKEEQRQREEQQRREAEERHHREQMKFQEDQERQRRREEERRQQDAERHHREDMEQRERQERDRQYAERKRAEEDRRRADRAESERRQQEDRNTRDQCNRCAQNSHCTMAFRRPNCASFKPR